MGDLIDMINVDENPRCKDVKRAIIYINLIGPPISFLLLLIGIFKMIFAKKHKSFLTKLILIIFVSEAVQSLSKLLQMLKYNFTDERDNKQRDDFDRPRSLICQIQIVLAISSDFCSLFSTLLLTLRCLDIIKNRKKFFDRGHNELKFIILDIGISIILGIGFLLLDRLITIVGFDHNISYRYDVRDRCSYWCWLEHYSSFACLALYVAVLISIIVLSLRTYRFLNKEYTKLKEENSFSKVSTINNILTQSSLEEKEMREEKKKLDNITKEENERIKNLKLMKIKSLVYPLVTIIYWIFAAIYRIFDDSFMIRFDYGDNADKLSEEEISFFEDYPGFQKFVEFFFVVFTFLSSIRGILYGFSFIAFEEKIFYNIFKKSCGICLKSEQIEEIDNKKELINKEMETRDIECDEEDD